MVDFSQFDNSWFDRGAPRWKEMLWMLCSAFFFQQNWNVWSKAKPWLLRRFGAKVGKNVLIKPQVSIKFPWKLTLGDYVWIGEQVWIDNLAPVLIGNHVCISQGALLLTGNHDYSKPSFDLIVKPIQLNDGSWVAARSVVCPGVQLHVGAILTVGSVATKDLGPAEIHQGNPAVFIRKRSFKE